MNRLRIIACNAVFFAILAICAPWNNLLADARLHDIFSRSVEVSTATVAHGDWTRLLEGYVRNSDGVNLFRYSSVSGEDRELLEGYLDSLTSVVVTELNPREQFAYWVNLYNALTVKVILDHYPVDSIRKISYSLLARGPWKEPLIAVEGVELSLDDVEHKILRPIFGDNRIHYAVNCASISCPNLQPVAFTADTLEDMLEAAAGQYINHPRGVSIIDGELVVSSIYRWYAEDFGGEDEAIIEHLAKFANDALAAQLKSFDSIDDYRYDWSLNE